MGTPPPPTHFRLQLMAVARFSFGNIHRFLLAQKIFDELLPVRLKRLLLVGNFSTSSGDASAAFAGVFGVGSCAMGI